MSVRRLANPRGVCVRTDGSGTPAAIQGVSVESVIEEWVVEDRWWSAQPVRRRYFELVLAGGRNVVVFKEVMSRSWFEQRG